MKRLSVLTTLCLLILSLCPFSSLAEQKKSVTILSIAHQVESLNQENLVLDLSGKSHYTVFTLGGEKPRIVIDLVNTVYRGATVQQFESSRLAKGIRAAVHRFPELKTRVVVDLIETDPIYHSHEFKETNNQLTLVLTTVAPDSEKTPPPVAKIEAPMKKKVDPVVHESKKMMAKKEPKKQESTSDQKTAELVTGSDRTLQMIAKLQKISFDDSSNRGEMVLFHLNDFYPPTVSAVEKGKPRVLCEFMDARLLPGVEEDLPVKGEFVDRIRTTAHSQPMKVEVVLELVPAKDYDLQQVFFKNDNLFVLIVNELQTDQKK